MIMSAERADGEQVRCGPQDPLRDVGLRSDAEETDALERLDELFLAERAWPTAQLGLAAIALQLLFGIPLGVIAATRRGRWPDHAANVVGLVGQSAPAFVVGTLALYVFAYRLGWFPTAGYGDGVLDRLHHLVLPATTLAFLPPTKPEHRPAMISAFALPDEPGPGVVGEPRNVQAVHLTLLRPDGTGKADVPQPKLMVGSPGPLPIVLAPVNDLLGLAITEGIETGLSVYAATGLGVWVAGAGDTLALREIRTGRTNDGMVEVLAGLSAGEKVVTSGTVFIDRAARAD